MFSSAFASSRKFIWDAQAVQLETNKVMAMSFYPKEGLDEVEFPSEHFLQKSTKTDKKLQKVKIKSPQIRE